MATPAFQYQEPFPLAKDETKYRLLSSEGVSVATFDGKEILKVDPEGLAFLAHQALRDVSFLLRPEHLEQVAAILADPEASPNDRGVAVALLRNAEVAANFVLPLCQDTGTATIVGKKGQQVWTGARDEEYLSKGVHKTYTEENLRYSQTVPLTTCTTRSTRGPTSPPRSTSTPRKGRSTSSSSSPRAAGPRTRCTFTRRRRRC